MHAVSLRFDAGGAYLGYDTGSPMTTSDGKRRVVESLALDGPILAVGDGATDLAMRDAVDLFAAFTGFTTRPNVVAGADVVVASFEELERVVLSPPDPAVRGARDRIRRSERLRPSVAPDITRETRPEL